MFIIFATKPLNDGTRGFRFNVAGKKGIVRLRKRKSLPVKLERLNPCLVAAHMGKLSVYVESKATPRKLRHFAG